MARVTTEDCADYIDNQFLLVAVASKRSRQLNEGYLSKIETGDDKPTVHALREIAAGKVNAEVLQQPSEYPRFAEPETSAAESAEVNASSEDGNAPEMLSAEEELRRIILEAEANDAAEEEKKLAEEDY